MQDFISALEDQYQKILSCPVFQHYFSQHFNQLLYAQPDAYKGLARTLIFKTGAVKLYRYAPLRKKRSAPPPLLIIYAFVNRPSILDIQPDRSFIQKLLDNNLDVYLLDWGDPRPEDAQKSLQHYIQIIHKSLNKINAPNINLMGICQGGTLSLCYAALYPQKINTLIPIVTPVDFQNTLLADLLKNIDTQALIKHTGNIPGRFLAAGLQSLKPFRLFKLTSVKPDFFIRMEQWIHDCPDHPGRAFHEFIHQFYQCNNLARGQCFIGKHRIDLSVLKMPILNIYAEQDHLVPPQSAKALGNLTGSLAYQELAFSGGHIGVFVSQKALDSIPAAIADYIKNKQIC